MVLICDVVLFGFYCENYNFFNKIYNEFICLDKSIEIFFFYFLVLQ